MTTKWEPLPVSGTVTPTDAHELAAVVRSSHDSDQAIYPVGGATSLDFGLIPRKPGQALSLAGLNRVLDYPARDLTITVEAGLSMQLLADTLAREGQRLPIDVPQAAAATLGGVVATNGNGPRRYGQGTVRDYVIGIHAVDGRGKAFKGGGRVVKNVAGYDFCKLLTGSLGTLGVITQVTLKLRPLAERLAILVCPLRNATEAEGLLAKLVHSATRPVAVELLAGPAWSEQPALASLRESSTAWGFLAVALEGTAVEVRWMVDQLGQEWWEQGVSSRETLVESDAAAFLRSWVEFPASPGSPLTTQASVVPSGVVPLIDAVRRLDPQSSLLSHAGNGIVVTRFAQAPAVTKGFIGQVRTAAAAAHGHVVVLRTTATAEATHQNVWGPLSSPPWLMTSVKQQFDPRNILNPDRFVYSGGAETAR